MASIFVSYARESDAAVQSLAADVEALDHTVWVDHDLKGGREWWDQILAHIRDCNVFMMTLSPESLSSAACKREYTYAAELGKPILPVLIAEGVSVQTLPSRLSQIQYVDYRKRDVASALKLANALGAVPPAPALPDPLPEPPAAPLSYLGGLAEQIDDDKPLDAKDQSALVSSLRRALREAETKADARHLLQRLRKRNDLYANSRDEIDELLEKPAEAARILSPPPVHASTPSAMAAPGPQAPTLVAPTTDPPAKTDNTRIVGAVAGGIIATVVGGVMMVISGREIEIAAIASVLGAITGGIVGNDKRLISHAVAGALLAALVVIFIYYPNMGAVLATTVAFAPGGAIAGAIVGIAIGKLSDRHHLAR